MSMTILDFVAILVFVLLLVLIISSSIYDFILQKRSKSTPPRAAFIAFSLQRNVRDLFKIEPKNPKSIECFHGLRALASFWVISGHRILHFALMSTQPLNSDNSFLYSVIKVLHSNDYAADIFFLLTGVLITQSILKSLDQKKMNIFKIYIGRYCRYMPTLAVLLLFFMSSFPNWLIDDPMDDSLDLEIEKCYKYWWTNLLLIQNYVCTVEEMCIATTWYLNVDFHLIILSPIFIHLLRKFKIKTLWIFVVIILSTQIGIFFGRYYEAITPTHIYYQSHFRIAQFLVGIALGYIMYERKGKNYMRKKAKFIGWVVSLSVFAAIKIYHTSYEYQPFAEAFHASIHRIAWCGLVGWIIYVCHHLESGGIVNSFLSYPLWQPIAKISMSIYLIHYIYIKFSIANMAPFLYMNLGWLIHIIFGDIAILILFAIIMYVMIEAPSNWLLKCILK